MHCLDVLPMGVCVHALMLHVIFCLPRAQGLRWIRPLLNYWQQAMLSSQLQSRLSKDTTQHTH